jgi:hypothetical protein
MDYKTCAVCDHEFGILEERLLVVCEHGTMLCHCGVYAYACLSHQQEVPRTPGSFKRPPLHMSTMVLPGNWEIEAVMAGHQVIRATMRQPLTVSVEGMDDLLG